MVGALGNHLRFTHSGFSGSVSSSPPPSSTLPAPPHTSSTIQFCIAPPKASQHASPVSWKNGPSGTSSHLGSYDPSFVQPVRVSMSGW